MKASHSRSSSSASNASQQSIGSSVHHGGTLPRAKPKKDRGDITPKLSRQTASDVDVHAHDESSPHRTIRKYLSDDAVRETLPRKMKVNSSKSDSTPSKASRPSSANSNASIDDRTLAEEHNNMIFDVKAMTDYLLDLQNLVRAC